jgi:nitroreductase
MNLEKAIRSRRSIRKYRNRPVPEAVIRRLLDLSRHAPSSMNGQPCHFVIVRHSATKRALAEIKNRYCPPEKRAYKADFLKEATILVVCVEKERSYDRTIENAVLAAAMFMLAAHGRGLGTVYMSAYQKGKPALMREISRLLRLPKYVLPIAIIPFGYPKEVAGKKELRELKEITHFERF